MFKMLKVPYDPNMPEMIIYFYIEILGDFLWVQRRCKNRGEMGFGEGLEDEQNAYSDQQTLVELLKSREGFAFADHDEYMKWYRWWNNWHKNELTDEQWNKLDRLMESVKTEEDCKEWRPSGDWRNV